MALSWTSTVSPDDSGAVMVGATVRRSETVTERGDRAHLRARWACWPWSAPGGRCGCWSGTSAAAAGRSSARALRRLTAVSALVVLVTVVFLRPWYWDLAIAVGGRGRHCWACTSWCGRSSTATSPASWGAIAVAMVSVVLGSALVTLGGHRGGDRRGRAGGGHGRCPCHTTARCSPIPCSTRCSGGPPWDGHGATPALAQAAAFQRALPTSQWASAVVGSGFGVGSHRLGRLLDRPDAARRRRRPRARRRGRSPTSSTVSSTGTSASCPCPGFTATEVPQTLPADAVVALWLDPGVAYELGGRVGPRLGAVAGAARRAGHDRPDRWVRRWGRPSCATQPGVPIGVPSFASPDLRARRTSSSRPSPTLSATGGTRTSPCAGRRATSCRTARRRCSSAAPAFEGEVADLCEPGQPDAPAQRQRGDHARATPRPGGRLLPPRNGCVS